MTGLDAVVIERLVTGGILAAVAILGGYWYYFAQFTPQPDFDYARVNFPAQKFDPVKKTYKPFFEP